LFERKGDMLCFGAKFPFTPNYTGNVVWQIKGRKKSYMISILTCSVLFLLTFQHLLPPIDQTIHLANITYLLSKLTSKLLSFKYFTRVSKREKPP